MGLFDAFKKKEALPQAVDVSDEAIVALADGEPIVEADLRKLSKKYEMPVMLIVTNANEQTIQFRTPCHVERGETVIL